MLKFVGAFWMPAINWQIRLSIIINAEIQRIEVKYNQINIEMIHINVNS